MASDAGETSTACLSPESVTSSRHLTQILAATANFVRLIVSPDTTRPLKTHCDNKPLRHASTLKSRIQVSNNNEIQMGSTVTPPYFLSRQAHVCVASDTMFLLDEANGKYLSIGSDHAASLAPFILDWPIKSENRDSPPLLQSLLERSLITKDPKLGKSATPSTIQLPTTWLQDSHPRGRPDITGNDFYRFSFSVAYALYGKKFFPFRKIVSTVQKRKQSTQARPAEPDLVASLVRVFDWLRPLAFKKTNECFLYCLALNEFLSKYGICPTWIFAVQAQPFTAHCWLQYGDQALTDIPFNLRRMVPILVL